MKLRNKSPQTPLLYQPDCLAASQGQLNEVPAYKRKVAGMESRRKFFESFRFEVRTRHVGIERCLAFIAQNFDRPIQVKDLVRVSDLSRRGFCKAFSKYTGANPGAVLNQIRIEHAKNILAEHDLTLNEIARRCGYRSLNTFCVAFQRSTGVAPKQFQKNYWMAIIRNHKQSAMPPARFRGQMVAA